MHDRMSATGEIPSLPNGTEEEAVTYEPVEFDPEQTLVDDEVDAETLALRDALRDIFACDGRVELLM
jgi:hypothetical protein